MVLNEEYSFSDVRYESRSPRRNDFALSFSGYPEKLLLQPGAVLTRLEFSVQFGIFTRVWWMREAALRQLISGTAEGAQALRTEWQHAQAMPKAAKGVRTQVIEIVLTAPVYAWIGLASPLFHKAGGAEQVYLPNLAKGAGPARSNFAALRRTYTLPA